jgi:hypothetical protein
MSLSNPTENAPNPATRWFEWNGEKGELRYYDKEAKKNIDVPLPFAFVLLDELASVRGWHDASKSGIYSNEVRDTTKDVLVVKSFKGGLVAEGLYKDIKLAVNNEGGAYNANCYIAFKDGDKYSIGSLRFKGAALGAWMEFRKANRGVLTQKAVLVHGFTEGQKGRVIFRVPQFRAVDVAGDKLAAAIALDKELQKWLASYLTRNKREQAEAVGEHPAHHVTDEDIAQSDEDGGGPSHLTDDDIPF